MASIFSWALLVGSSATPASAALNHCTASIDGESLGAAFSPDDAITVAQSDVVPVSGTIEDASATETVTYKVSMSFDVFGKDISWQVASGTTTGNHWASTVDVSKYATYGTGLYYVKALGLTSGGGSCLVGGFVNVTASGLSDAAIAGIAVGAMGVIGVGTATAVAVSQSDKVVEPEVEAAKDAATESRLSAQRKGCCGMAMMLAVPMTIGSAFWEAFRTLGGAVKGMWS